MGTKKTKIFKFLFWGHLIHFEVPTLFSKPIGVNFAVPLILHFSRCCPAPPKAPEHLCSAPSSPYCSVPSCPNPALPLFSSLLHFLLGHQNSQIRLSSLIHPFNKYSLSICSVPGPGTNILILLLGPRSPSLPGV